jgi:hypothetical protein
MLKYRATQAGARFQIAQIGIKEQALEIFLLCKGTGDRLRVLRILDAAFNDLVHYTPLSYPIEIRIR